MNKNYLLTIAVPTYNGSKTISNMLNILLPQINERIEIIVSDNCSTDNTSAIIKQYIERYPFIKYVRNSQNLGADGNFLNCARLAQGKYTMLISDDDIIVEGAITKICNFLDKYPETQLAFLYTVGFRDKYTALKDCNIFNKFSKKPRNDIFTTDKYGFFEYVGRQWGFTSSFLWNTSRFRHIDNPEKYYNTYWLQSYIHIFCSDRIGDGLGIIAGPCIAAGGYGIVGNYDTAQIEGVYYKKMLDFAVKHAGYDQQQLSKFWIWKVCYLSSRAIVKERAIGKKMTSTKTLFEIMWRYPYAWIHLFPFLILPDSFCKLITKVVRIKQKRKFISYVNRPTD